MLKMMYDSSLKLIVREAKMEVPEDFRKCVVFLCTDDTNDRGRHIKVPRATAFFLAVPIEDDVAIIYLVTARHNIEESRQYGELFVRFNKSSGGFHYAPIDQDSFDCHPQTDVAVTLLPNVGERCEIYCIPARAVVNPEMQTMRLVKEGQEVVIPSLFSEYSGIERNQPILRFGRVSLAQPEKIPLRLSPDTKSMLVDAILVESLSWGGESGSPVFIEGSKIYSSKEPKPYSLLGVVHGHYPIPQKVMRQKEEVGQVDLNAGVMVVIPWGSILDTLALEECMKKRNKAAGDKEKMVKTPTPDFLSDRD